LYESLGYFSVEIRPAVVDRPDPARSRLVIDIASGPRSRIGSLHVNASGLAEPEVLARLDLRPGEPWDVPALERRARRFVESLREEGHYESSITWSVDRRADAPVVDVTIDASAGPLVELVFDSPLVSERRLREFVPVAREGAVDEDLLEDAKRRIEQWLHEEGYARATVDYERTALQDRLRLTFRVRRGPLYEVDRVEIDGAAESRLHELAALLPLQPGQPFSEEALAVSVATLTRMYQARGFGSVRVQSNANLPAGQAVPDEGSPGRVRPRLVVVEGPQTLIGRVIINGSTAPEGELRALMGLKPGAPFYAPQLLADRNALSAYYVNRGYRQASVDVIPRPSTQGEGLDIVYEITEGPQFLVGHVLIAGNTRTDTSTIARELALTPGEPLGTQDLADARRRLNALGLFRRVELSELSQPGRRTTDLTVTVEEAPATTIGYGAGLEGGRRLVRSESSDVAVEKLEVSPRGFFEIGRRNLWGKNRSVNLFTRFSFRDRGGTESDATEDDSAFYEFRVVGTYREPRVFGTEADAQVNGFVEQGVRSSFNFARQAVNAEMARPVGSRMTLVGRYSFGKTRLFDQRLVEEEKPIIDRLYPQVRLSTLSTVVVQDTRSDPLDPRSGHVLSVQGDLSAPAIGSEVGFVKSFAQGFFYRRVPGAGDLIFAGGARLGLATGFGVEVQADAEPVEDAIRDLPASERFYAGGSTTVRGYALDRLGDDATIDSDGFPQGGNALVILNAELRFPVWRSFGGVAFLDAGNVFARTADLDLSRIKGSAGAGLRYRSPIGPVRLDVGLKFDPRQLGDGQLERRWEIRISLGQAF
jgi:outer membrane protein assembly complex protein YaeT